MTKLPGEEQTTVEDVTNMEATDVEKGMQNGDHDDVKQSKHDDFFDDTPAVKSIPDENEADTQAEKPECNGETETGTTDTVEDNEQQQTENGDAEADEKEVKGEENGEQNQAPAEEGVPAEETNKESAEPALEVADGAASREPSPQTVTQDENTADGKEEDEAEGHYGVEDEVDEKEGKTTTEDEEREDTKQATDENQSQQAEAEEAKTEEEEAPAEAEMAQVEVEDPVAEAEGDNTEAIQTEAAAEDDEGTTEKTSQAGDGCLPPEGPDAAESEITEHNDNQQCEENRLETPQATEDNRIPSRESAYEDDFSEKSAATETAPPTSERGEASTEPIESTVEVAAVDTDKDTDGRSSPDVEEQGELYRGEDRTEEAVPEGSENCRGEGQWKSVEQQAIADAMMVQKTDREAMEEAQEDRDRILSDYEQLRDRLVALEEDMEKKNDQIIVDKELTAKKDKQIADLQNELQDLQNRSLQAESNDTREKDRVIKDLQERLAILARENEEKDKRIFRLENEVQDMTSKLRETERKLINSEAENVNQQNAQKSKTCVVM